VQCFVLIFMILLDFLVGKSRSKYSALNYGLKVHLVGTGKLLHFSVSVNNVTHLDL
jgi:hypothetical protein